MFSFESKNQGMTLIETTVALGVLVVGLVSILSLSVYSTKLSNVSEKQVIALNLAREGVELVRQIKDYSRSGNQVNVFLDEDKSFFGTGSDSINGCYVVDSQDSFKLSNQNYALGPDFDCEEDLNVEECANCWLYRDDTTDFLSTDDNFDRSMYRRIVRIENLETGVSYAKKITSKVIWANNESPQEVLLETVFYDW
jgi:Tfp pilus assembly protein PilV